MSEPRRRDRARIYPRAASDNAYDDLHEHPTEWRDMASVEPRTPHPGSDPLEVSTEPRPDHPERGRRVARPSASRHREPRPGITRAED
jgi:hypothetical protein